MDEDALTERLHLLQTKQRSLDTEAQQLYNRTATLHAEIVQMATDMKRLELLSSQTASSSIQSQFHQLQLSMPRQPRFMLSLVLGASAPSLFQLHSKERLRFKHAFEHHKVVITAITLLLTFLAFIYPHFVLDKLIHLILFYYYLSVAMREEILWVNGSRVREWWFWHHWISCGAAVGLIVWPWDAAYIQFRSRFLLYLGYIGIVQTLQFRYQMARLYVLRSLSKAQPMDTTTDTAALSDVNLQKSLMILLPFFLLGQLFQLYIAAYIYTLVCWGDECCWYRLLLGGMLAFLGIGNITTMFSTFLHNRN